MLHGEVSLVDKCAGARWLALAHALIFGRGRMMMAVHIVCVLKVELSSGCCALVAAVEAGL